MQSSYNLIKSTSALESSKKIIETNYVVNSNVEEKDEKVYSIEDEFRKNYEALGFNIIKKAKLEAEDIKIKSQKIAYEIEKKAYEEGYNQGKLNGYEDGYSKGYTEALEKVKLDTEEEVKDKEMAETAKKSIVNDTPAQPLIDMLLSDTLKVTFPTDATNESDEDAEDVLYMVAMDEKGIRCIKNGSDTYEWEIEFEDDSQYEAARDFLGWASPRMDNLLFAAHDNFWMDYLNGDLDVDAFKDFLVGTNNGIPNYGIGDEENMYIDETKLQWTKYMNPLGAHFGTPEELFPIPEL